MSDGYIQWDDHGPLEPALVLPTSGDYLRIQFEDGRIFHAIVADSRENDDGSGGTIRLIGDPTNEVET